MHMVTAIHRLVRAENGNLVNSPIAVRLFCSVLSSEEGLLELLPRVK